MTAFVTQTSLDTCTIYRRAIAAGEDQRDVIGELAQMYGVNRPAIWKRLRAGGAIPGEGGHDGSPIGRNYAGFRINRVEPRLEDLPPPVNRDPCQRCGVRRDVGCEHTTARLGLVFG